MKKTFLFGIVAAMLAASCTEEESLNQIASGEGITFTSSVASRATDTSFEAGDEIGISMYVDGNVSSAANNVRYTLTDANTFTGVEITWEAAGGASSADFMGVYPYKEGSISDGKYSFTLSDENELSENDVMYAHTPNVSNGTETVSLNFKHKLVKVVMKVKDQDGTAVIGATMTINKQQLEGMLDLTTGDVTSTDVADNKLAFASNATTPGEYQTIVMPSAATQGRIITITANGKTYPCPVDMYAFESGKKITFSATIYTDGTVTSEGKVTITADVTNWSEQKVEEGWIFGEDADFDITDKPSYQLATNISLSSAPSTIEVDGILNENDVYSFVYTRNDATEAAIITVGAEGGSSREFTLPAGSTSGTILIPVSEYNTTGMTISSKAEGITLTKVLVYTSQDIVVPIELWSNSNPSVGNGVADTDWPNDILNFTISEEARKSLTLGATLNVYYTGTPSTVTFSYYNAETGYGNSGPVVYGDGSETKHESEGYLSVTVLKPLLDAITANNYVVGLIGSGNTITRITLVPAPANSGVNENILWMGESVQQYSKWQFVNVMLPATVSANSVFRITLRNPYGAPAGTVYGAKLVWNNDSGDNDETYVFEAENASVTTTVESEGNYEGYIDVTITSEILSDLQENGMLGGGTALALLGGKKANEGQEGAYTGNSIVKVELLPANAGTAE